MALSLRVLLFGTLFLACSFSTADGLPTLVTSTSVPASTPAAFISGSSIILPASSATTTQTAGSSFISSIVEDNGFSAESTIPGSSTLLNGGSTSVAVRTVKPSQENTPASIVANSTSRRQLTTAPTASSTTPASVVRVNVRQVVGFFVFLLLALCYISAISVKRDAAARRSGTSRPTAAAPPRASPMPIDVELQPRPVRMHGHRMRPSAVLARARHSISTLPVYVAMPTAPTTASAYFTINALPPSYAERALGAASGAGTGAVLEAGVGNLVVYEEPEEMDGRTS